MAIAQHAPDLLRDETAPLRVVPPPPRIPVAPSQRDTVGEEFQFGNGARAHPAVSRPRVRRGIVVRLAVLLCLVVVVVLVVRNLTGGGPASVPATPPGRPAAPAAAPLAQAPAGVPMSVVASGLSPVSTPGSYRVSVTVRNPTDAAAEGVTVQVTLRDGSGRVVVTQSRSLGTLPSGKAVDVTIAGELDTSAALPTGVEVSATAAQLEAPA